MAWKYTPEISYVAFVTERGVLLDFESLVCNEIKQRPTKWNFLNAKIKTWRERKTEAIRHCEKAKINYDSRAELYTGIYST